MVVAIVTDKNKALQLQMEKELADELSAHGVSTVTASEQFGTTTFQNMKEKAVLRQLRASNVDGIITISLLNKEKETSYVPGTVNYYPMPTYVRYGRFWGYYGTYYNRVYSPGYYEQSTTYFLIPTSMMLMVTDFCMLPNQKVLIRHLQLKWQPHKQKPL